VPLFTIAILALILGFLKLFGSVALCVIEVICAILLIFGASYESYQLTVFFIIFMLLTMIQFLWIFGQAIQIHIETGISPLFNDVKQSIFLWVIIVTFVFDIFFAGICYEAYKSFKY
jgi:hypothetical protein